jgi:hypothetical protein
MMHTRLCAMLVKLRTCDECSTVIALVAVPVAGVIMDSLSTVLCTDGVCVLTSCRSSEGRSLGMLGTALLPVAFTMYWQLIAP